jgi:hypothetical protein
MSGLTFKGQTAWEESEEEVQQRLARAKSTESNWLSTVVWIVLGLAILVFLVLHP